MTQHTLALATFYRGKARHAIFDLRRGPLTDNGATPWYTSVGLGTPPQRLRFMVDTGTTNTWITDSRCISTACAKHACFRALASSTFHPSDAMPKGVDFGPWGAMTVELGYDICHLMCEEEGRRALVPLKESMSIYLASCYEGAQFAQLACDGGFAIPAIPWGEPSALMEQLWRQQIIEYPLASFYFDAVAGSGRCLLGALDPCRYDASTVNCLPVTPLDGDLRYLWTVKLSALRCGDVTLGENLDFVLDTGSSVFKGGHNIIDRLLKHITDNGNRPSVVKDPADLSRYPNLSLDLGDAKYILSPPQYFMLEADGAWHLGVQHLDGLPDELLVVGSVFLDTVYSAFFFKQELAEPTVMLATPVRTRMSVTGGWINQFGSTMDIGPVAADGTFSGTYSSHTGATGVYPLVGVTDPAPEGAAIAVSFSVSWRSLVGDPDPSWHWVSGFTGLLQTIDGVETINTTYLLQQNATASVPDWMATAVYTSVFTRVSAATPDQETPAAQSGAAPGASS